MLANGDAHNQRGAPTPLTEMNCAMQLRQRTSRCPARADNNHEKCLWSLRSNRGGHDQAQLYVKDATGHDGLGEHVRRGQGLQSPRLRSIMEFPVV